MLILSVFFFFFKQKTAYEMRISDWSSDVCSSDLVTLHGPFESHDLIPFFYVGGCARAAAVARLDRVDRHLAAVPAGLGGVEFLRPCGRRSEEHTSELQSLMRISYAVFCLKKKKTITIIIELLYC